MRDIFHREWNDCMGAITASGFWFVVLLTSMVFNLPYVPWDGSAWFQKMVEGAEDLCKKSGVAGLLF